MIHAVAVDCKTQSKTIQNISPRLTGFRIVIQDHPNIFMIYAKVIIVILSGRDGVERHHRPSVRAADEQGDASQQCFPGGNPSWSQM